MSLGKQKNLIILVVVATGLLAGTVLLGGYLPGAARTDERVMTCPSAEAGVKCAAKADGTAFPQVVTATDGAAGKPCCGAEKPAGSCQMGAPGCEKPERCCAEPGTECCEQPPMGCSDKPEVPGGCCAAKAETASE